MENKRRQNLKNVRRKKTLTAERLRALAQENYEETGEYGRGFALSIKGRLILLAVIAALLVGALTLEGVWGLKNTSQSAYRIQNENLRPVAQLGELRALLYDDQLQLLGVHNTPTAFAINLAAENLEHNRQAIDRTWRVLKDSTHSADEKALASNFDLALERYQAAAQVWLDSLGHSPRHNAPEGSFGGNAGSKRTGKPIYFTDRELENLFTKVINPSFTELMQYSADLVQLQLAASNRKVTQELDDYNWHLRALGIIALLGLGVVVFVSYSLLGRITGSIRNIYRFIRALAQGDLLRRRLPAADDEFGELSLAVNHLSLSLRRVAAFAAEIGEGKFQSEFKPLGDNDQLGVALTNMRNRLAQVDEEDRRRNWAITGQAQFGEILRLANDIQGLGDRIISSLTKYIEGNQGAFFMLDDDDPADVTLRMTSSYAYNKKKFVQREFRLGEGFVGQAAVERDTILITDIPSDYVTMTSGLGEATPKSLLIVPLVFNDVVYGVVEFASFTKFKDYEIEFVKELSEKVGAAMANLKNQAKTQHLLKESQLMSTELQDKQAVLLANAQVMEETHQAMVFAQSELKGQLSALNNAGIVSESNLEGDITFANDRFLLITKYLKEEVIGRNHRILKSGAATPEIFSGMWSAIMAGRVWKGELKNKAKDGSFFWVDVTITPIYDEKGEIKKFVSVQFDVTNQKVQEEQIRTALEESMAQEEELRQNAEELEAQGEEMRRTQLELTGQISALNNSAIVSEADLQGRIITINDQFLFISRYTREELIGQNHRLLKSGHQTDDLYQRLWKTIAGGEVWKGEFKNRAKDGSYYWITASITPVLDLQGKPVKYIGVAFDITAQKLQEEQIRAALEISQAQEEELRQNSEELQAAQDEMRKTQVELRGQIGALNNAGIVAETDLRGNITLVNEEFCRISQYFREELLGQNHRMLKSNHWADDFFIQLWDTVTRGQVWQGVFKNRAKDGSYYWVKSSITPVLGFDGKPVKYIGVSFDITAQVEQEQRIQEALGVSQQQEELLRSQEDQLREALSLSHQQAEQIRQKQEQMDSVFANIPGIIYRRLPDAAWTPQLISEQAKEITGYTQAEFLSHEVELLSLIHPDDKEYVVREIELKLKERDNFLLDYRILPRDGELKWVREEGSGIFNERDELLFVDGAIFDITPQKKLDQELRETLEDSQRKEEQLRQNASLMQAQQIELAGQIGALNNTGMVTETNLQGEITFANDEVVRTWGYSQQEILGQTHRLVKSTEHAPAVYEEMWRKVSGGQVWRGELKNRAKDGSDFWVLLTITPVLDLDGKPLKYIAVAFDINKQKRQASRIRAFLEVSQRQEEELRTTATNLKQAQSEILNTQLELRGQIGALNNAAIVSETDLEGRISFVNDEATYVWGYSREEVVGQPHNLLKSSQHAPEFFARMWDKISQGFIWRGEVCNRAKDGTDFWVSLTITPVLNQEGQPFKYIGVAFDITKQRKQALRIREALQKAEEQENAFREEISQLQLLVSHAGQPIGVRQQTPTVQPAPQFELRLDLAGNILFASDVFAHHLHLQPQQLLDLPFYDLLSPEDANQLVDESFYAELLGAEHLTRTLLHITPEGIPVQVTYEFTLQQDEHGQPRYIIAQGQLTAQPVDQTLVPIAIAHQEGLPLDWVDEFALRFSFSAAGKVERANASFLAATGFAVDQLVGRSAEEVLHGLTALEIAQELNGSPYLKRTVEVGSNGRRVALEGIFFKDGKVADGDERFSFAGGRMQLLEKSWDQEPTLQAEPPELSALFEAIPALEMNADWQVSRCSPALLQQFKSEEAEFIGKPWESFFSPAGASLELVKTHLSAELGWEGTGSLHSGADQVPVKVIVRKVGLNQQASYLAIFNPQLTVFVLEEEAKTDESQPQLASSIQTVREPALELLNDNALISETDLQGKISFANEEFVRSSGYTAEELLGNNHNMLKAGILRDGVYFDLWATISRGRIWIGELANRSKQGNLYWVSLTILPVLGAHNKPIKYLGVAFQIPSPRSKADQLPSGAKSGAGFVRETPSVEQASEANLTGEAN